MDVDLPWPDPVARSLALLPMVTAAAAETEASGRIAAWDALVEAGLFRLLLPRSVGGSQVDPCVFLRVVETLARGDASTAWCVAQTSVCSTAAARLPLAVARAMFGDGRSVLAWGHGTEGRARPCAGGWTVSGRWGFGSGGRQARWLGGACTVFDADGAPAGMRVMLFPQEAARFEATWDVVGLRGTGSDSYAVLGLVVPEDWSFRFGDAVQPHAEGALYALPPDSLWAAGFASAALGVARAMLEALLDLARGKTPRGMGQTLAGQAGIQALVGETDAALRAASALLQQAMAALFTEPGLERRIGVRQAASHAMREARRAAEAVYHAAGAGAGFRSGPFERRMRDMHMMGQHVHGRAQHFETVGRFLLGQDVDPAFL